MHPTMNAEFPVKYLSLSSTGAASSIGSSSAPGLDDEMTTIALKHMIIATASSLKILSPRNIQERKVVQNTEVRKIVICTVIGIIGIATMIAVSAMVADIDRTNIKLLSAFGM